MSGSGDSPWICPRCAHFVVRVDASPETPTHDCEVAGEAVELVPFLDSGQALEICNAIGPAPARPTPSRSRQ